MKTLSNCNPREFLIQTNKIRKSVKNWLDITKIMEIRKRMPTLLPVPDVGQNPTEKQLAELEAVLSENHKAISEQNKKNLLDMLDAALEIDLEATLEVLCHISFIDPKDVDDYKMSDLLCGYNEIINCSEVLDFFTSLTNLVQTDTSGTAKA